MDEHWGSLGTQHPAGLGDGVGDGATTMPWAQLHHGYNKGLMAAVSPQGTPMEGGILSSPHIYRNGGCW